MNRIVVTIGILLVCFVLPIHAQSGRQPGSQQPINTATPQPVSTTTPQRQNEREGVIVVDSDLVVLDARVLNIQTGRFVGGLKKEDFEVYEDGKKQEITHFSEDTPPLSVVFLIEMNGPATQGVFAKISTNIEQIFQHLRPDDQAAVMLVGADTQTAPGTVYFDIWLLHAFTRDKKLLANKETASALLGMREMPPILTRLPTKHQAIYEAELLLEKVPPSTNRRVIVTLTDDIPWFTRKRVSGNPFSGSGNKTISKKDLSRRLFTAGTMLCALVTPDPVWTPRIKPLLDEGESHPITKAISFVKGYNYYENAEMGFYAEPTGGEIILATEEKAAAQLAELIDHLYVRYSFGYVSSNRKRDGKFRKLSLKVSSAVESREGGVTIATKAGYYPPPKNSKAKP